MTNEELQRRMAEIDRELEEDIRILDAKYKKIWRRYFVVVAIFIGLWATWAISTLLRAA